MHSQCTLIAPISSTLGRSAPVGTSSFSSEQQVFQVQYTRISAHFLIDDDFDQIKAKFLVEHGIAYIVIAHITSESKIQIEERR